MNVSSLMNRLVTTVRKTARQVRAPMAGPPHLWAGGRDGLLQRARASGDPFRHSPYYDAAEPVMAAQWEALIWPMIRDLDFSCVLDLAAGHGRNSVKLREFADRIIIVDITQENIDFCRERFRGDGRFQFLKNDGVTLAGVADGSVSLVYCFDAMVHFDS